jgi:hypothetical protein
MRWTRSQSPDAVALVTSTPVVSAVDAEFNAFLHAPIGEEESGMTLSVVSALARQNLDPWAHASYLNSLPWQAAVRELAAMIAGLPAGPIARQTPEAIATRLIALLPKRPDAHPRRALSGPARAFNPAAWFNHRAMLWAYLGSLLISLWIIAALHRPPPTDKAVAPSSTPALRAHRPSAASVAMTQQARCRVRRACRGGEPTRVRTPTATAE